MLRKVKLHGELAKFVGHEEFEAVVKTTAEAVKFLITNFPKLEAYMSDKYYQVLVGDTELDEEQIHDPVGKSDIHIVPVITGAGGGSLLEGVFSDEERQKIMTYYKNMNIIGSS